MRTSWKLFFTLWWSMGCFITGLQRNGVVFNQLVHAAPPHRLSQKHPAGSPSVPYAALVLQRLRGGVSESSQGSLPTVAVTAGEEEDTDSEDANHVGEGWSEGDADAGDENKPAFIELQTYNGAESLGSGVVDTNKREDDSEPSRQPPQTNSSGIPASNSEDNEGLRRPFTSWTPPRYLSSMRPEEIEAIRHHFDIEVDGDDVAPPVASFAEMKLPREIQSYLQDRGIQQPSPIQMQGIPCALQGRDVISAAPTGSGKSLLLLLPLLSSAFHAIATRTQDPGTSPLPRQPRGAAVVYGLLVAPTKELAFQLLDEFQRLARLIASERGLRIEGSALVGPEFDGPSTVKLRHVVFGTPGRVAAAMEHGALSVQELRLLCIDEVHRVYTADEQPPSAYLHQLLSGMGSHVQRICCSSTLPETVHSYLSQHLHKPIAIRVGPAHGLSADVTHEVHVLPETEWLPFLVCEGGALFKRAPPVLLFCSERGQVERAHAFLRDQGVRAGMLHSKMSGADKSDVVHAFRSGAVDVLVATDMAGSGLHFSALRHVVCLGMDRKGGWVHVHRAGRVGRGGAMGLVTLLLEPRTRPELVLDLRDMLVDAGQSTRALSPWM